MIEAEGHGEIAAQVGGHRVVALVAEHHPAHLLEQGDAAAAAAGHHQLLERLDAAQASLQAQRQGGDLISRSRRLTGLAQGRQHVLLLQRLAHLQNREVAFLQAGRIEPEAVGQAAAAEQAHIADAADAA